jgi:hypothetical protein
MCSPCCARAASGQAAPEPTITLMKSRRRIAFTEAGTTPTRTRLHQGFAPREMGFRGQFARQQTLAAHVRFGSKADITDGRSDVRFTPKADISRRGYRRHMLASQGCLSGGNPAER